MEFYVDADYSYYTSDYFYGSYSSDGSNLKFTMQKNQEHETSYVTVDGHELVTHMGGIIGITIGWSFHSVRSMVPWIMAGLANIMRFF